MTWPVLATFVVLAGVVVTLGVTSIAPDMVLLGGLVILLVLGIVPADQAFYGFSNEGLATIGALFVVAEGLRRTGGLNFVGARVLGKPTSVASAQLRVMLPVAAMSSFLNNTPVVAMMMPLVGDWARRHRISISHLLMPLSYASIIGGLMTLVGTSTTLVVNGLLLDVPGQRGLTMFELAWVGVPITGVGILFIALTGRWLIPDRRPAMHHLEDVREYTVEMMVAKTSTIVGETIESAGLRQLPGMYLIEIVRNEQMIAAPAPTTTIEAFDRLVFVGIVESVVDLQKIPGLTPATDQLFKIDGPRSHRCLVEAVVSSSSRFRGMSIREAQFRTHYSAVVIAVARDGQRIRKKVGDIVLQAGDTLLLETHPSFADFQRNSRDFFLVSRVENSTPLEHERAWISRLILAAMVILVATETMSMLRAACLAGAAMVATRCIRVSEAKRSIDWGVVLGVGAGLGIGSAMSTSGAAELLAGGLVDTIGDHPLVALAAIYATTTVLANLVTTKAAAVLVFPIAQAAAARLGVDFMPFAIALIVAAAAAFATPIGYQTNLMVYGPGGYRGADFLRMGVPLSIIVGIIVMLMVPLVWPFSPVA